MTTSNQGLLSDGEVTERIFAHIDHRTSDKGDEVWHEPVHHYHSSARFADEVRLLKHLPVPFCPSAAIPSVGDYVARSAAGTPLVVVRSEDGTVKAFRNACRHRGMQVAQGTGCAKYFVCSYHGWAYRLDGSLQHIPHRQGFPGVDDAHHGLEPVDAIENHGLIFVTQDTPIGRGALEGLDEIPDLLTPDQSIFSSNETTSDVNWKLNMEANLEGLHIKTTHPESFFPYGFDNLTILESFGNNSRVTFPFRRIEKLRGTPVEARNVAGQLTYVYHLFPNVAIAVLSNHTSVTISEPLTTTSTRFITYRMTNSGEETNEANLTRAKRDAGFLADTGSQEDAAAVRAIQEGLTSGANKHFTFGHYEKSIVHFHQTLTRTLERLPTD